MKASGTYVQVVDQSFKEISLTDFSLVVPMLTKAGKIGELNRVTVEDYERVLGYDLGYNGNYLGLKKILESVSYVDVMRINENPKYANVVFNTGGTFSVKDLDEGEQGSLKIATGTGVTGTNLFGFWKKTAGEGDDIYIQVTTKRKALDFAFNGSVLKIPDSVNTGSNGLEIRDQSGKVLVKGTGGTLTGVAGTTHALTAGTVTKSGKETTLTFTNVPSEHILATVSYVVDGAKDYVVSTFRESGTGVFQLLAEEEFSTDSTNVNFLDKKTFEYIKGEFYADPTGVVKFDKAPLINGDNGRMPLASELKLSVLDTSSATAIVMNGLTNIAVANAFSEKAEKTLKSIFLDAPNFEKFQDLLDWQKGLYTTEYAQLTAVSDQVETAKGIVSVFPSVYLAKTYAKMFRETGFTYYPPAGYDFASVSVEKLYKTDFLLYRDKLKLNKINYLVSEKNGTVIWEHRTRYGSESSLSNANTVWTSRGIANEYKAYMDNFAFKLQDPSMLAIIKAGLDSISNTYKENGFVWDYKISVPSWKDVLANDSTTVKIVVAIQIAKDAQVFEIAVILTGSQS